MSSEFATTERVFAQSDPVGSDSGDRGGYSATSRTPEDEVASSRPAMPNGDNVAAPGLRAKYRERVVRAIQSRAIDTTAKLSFDEMAGELADGDGLRQLAEDVADRFFREIQGDSQYRRPADGDLDTWIIEAALQFEFDQLVAFRNAFVAEALRLGFVAKGSNRFRALVNVGPHLIRAVVASLGDNQRQYAEWLLWDGMSEEQIATGLGLLPDQVPFHALRRDTLRILAQRLQQGYQQTSPAARSRSNRKYPKDPSRFINHCVPKSLRELIDTQGDVVDHVPPDGRRLRGITWGALRPRFRRVQPEKFVAEGNPSGWTNLLVAMADQAKDHPGEIVSAWILEDRGARSNPHGVGGHSFTVTCWVEPVAGEQGPGRVVFATDSRQFGYDEQNRELVSTWSGERKSLCEVGDGNPERTLSAWAVVYRRAADAENGVVVEGLGIAADPPPDELRIGQNRVAVSGAATLPFRERLRRAKLSGEPRVTVLSESGDVRVELAEFPDGSTYIRDATDTVDLAGSHLVSVAEQAAATAVEELGDELAEKLFNGMLPDADLELVRWAKAARARGKAAVDTELDGISPRHYKKNPSNFGGMCLYRDMDEAKYRRMMQDPPDPDSPAGMLRGLVHVVTGAEDSPYTARFRDETSRWLHHGVPRRIVAAVCRHVAILHDERWESWGWSDSDYERLMDNFRQLDLHAPRTPEQELAETHFIVDPLRRDQRVASLIQQYPQLEQLAASRLDDEVTLALGREFDGVHAAVDRLERAAGRTYSLPDPAERERFIADPSERGRMLADLARRHPYLAAEAKAILVREFLGNLAQQDQDWIITGHDHPDVGVDAVRDALRGLATALRLAPDLADHPLELEFGYPTRLTTVGENMPFTSGRHRIVLNRWAAARPDLLAQRFRSSTATGDFGYGTGRIFYDVVVHEALHVLDRIVGEPPGVLGGLSNGLEAALIAVHAEVEKRTGISREDWFALLPGYCFTPVKHPKTHNPVTVLNSVEALAQGGQEGEIRSATVGTPLWAIREYATTGQVPDIPENALIHLPPHPLDAQVIGSVTHVAKALRDSYGRDILDAQAVGGVTTLRALMAASSAATGIKWTRLGNIRGRLLKLGPGASCVVADVSYTDGRAGFQAAIYVMKNIGGKIYVQRESGELQSSFLAKSFVRPGEGLWMRRGVYQTHAILYDPQGNIVPGQRFAIPSPVPPEQVRNPRSVPSDDSALSAASPGSGQQAGRLGGDLSVWSARIDDSIRQNARIITVRGAGTVNGIERGAAEECVRYIHEYITGLSAAGIPVVLIFDGDGDNRAAPDVGSVFGTLADLLKDDPDVSFLAAQSEGWYSPSTPGGALTSATGTRYETYVFADDTPGGHAGLTQSAALVGYHGYEQIFVGPAGPIAFDQLHDLSDKASGRPASDPVRVTVLAAPINPELSAGLHTQLETADADPEKRARLRAKIEQRAEHPFGMLHIATGALAIDPDEYPGLIFSTPDRSDAEQRLRELSSRRDRAARSLGLLPWELDGDGHDTWEEAVGRIVAELSGQRRTLAAEIAQACGIELDPSDLEQVVLPTRLGHFRRLAARREELQRRQAASTELSGLWQEFREAAALWRAAADGPDKVWLTPGPAPELEAGPVGRLAALRTLTDQLADRRNEASQKVLAARAAASGQWNPEKLPEFGPWDDAHWEAELADRRSSVAVRWLTLAQEMGIEPAHLERVLSTAAQSPVPSEFAQRAADLLAEEDEIQRLAEPHERYVEAVRQRDEVAAVVGREMAHRHAAEVARERGGRVVRPHVAVLPGEEGSRGRLVVVALRGEHEQALPELIGYFPEYAGAVPGKRQFSIEFIELDPQLDGTVKVRGGEKYPGGGYWDAPGTDEVRGALLRQYAEYRAHAWPRGVGLREWLKILADVEGQEYGNGSAFYQYKPGTHQSHRIGDVNETGMLQLGRGLAGRGPSALEQQLARTRSRVSYSDGPVDLLRRLWTREQRWDSSRFRPRPGYPVGSTWWRKRIDGLSVQVWMVQNGAGRWLVAEPNAKDGSDSGYEVARLFSGWNAPSEKQLFNAIARALTDGIIRLEPRSAEPRTSDRKRRRRFDRESSGGTQESGGGDARENHEPVEVPVDGFADDISRRCQKILVGNLSWQRGWMQRPRAELDEKSVKWQQAHHISSDVENRSVAGPGPVFQPWSIDRWHREIAELRRRAGDDLAAKWMVAAFNGWDRRQGEVDTLAGVIEHVVSGAYIARAIRAQQDSPASDGALVVPGHPQVAAVLDQDRKPASLLIASMGDHTRVLVELFADPSEQVRNLLREIRRADGRIVIGGVDIRLRPDYEVTYHDVPPADIEHGLDTFVRGVFLREFVRLDDGSDFDEWIRGLGPEFFKSSEDTGGLSVPNGWLVVQRVLEAGDRLFVRTKDDDPQGPRAVARRVLHGELSFGRRQGLVESRQQMSEEVSRTIVLGSMTIEIQLGRNGSDPWCVLKSPDGSGISPDGVLAGWAEDVRALDPDVLVDYLSARLRGQGPAGTVTVLEGAGAPATGGDSSTGRQDERTHGPESVIDGGDLDAGTGAAESDGWSIVERWLLAKSRASRLRHASSARDDAAIQQAEELAAELRGAADVVVSSRYLTNYYDSQPLDSVYEGWVPVEGHPQVAVRIDRDGKPNQLSIASMDDHNREMNRLFVDRPDLARNVEREFIQIEVADDRRVSGETITTESVHRDRKERVTEALRDEHKRLCMQGALSKRLRNYYTWISELGKDVIESAPFSGQRWVGAERTFEAGYWAIKAGVVAHSGQPLAVVYRLILESLPAGDPRHSLLVDDPADVPYADLDWRLAVAEAESDPDLVCADDSVRFIVEKWAQTYPRARELAGSVGERGRGPRAVVAALGAQWNPEPIGSPDVVIESVVDSAVDGAVVFAFEWRTPGLDKWPVPAAEWNSAVAVGLPDVTDVVRLESDPVGKWSPVAAEGERNSSSGAESPAEVRDVGPWKTPLPHTAVVWRRDGVTGIHDGGRDYSIKDWRARIERMGGAGRAYAIAPGNEWRFGDAIALPQGLARNLGAAPGGWEARDNARHEPAGNQGMNWNQAASSAGLANGGARPAAVAVPDLDPGVADHDYFDNHPEENNCAALAQGVAEIWVAPEQAALMHPVSPQDPDVVAAGMSGTRFAQGLAADWLPQALRPGRSGLAGVIARVRDRSGGVGMMALALEGDHALGHAALVVEVNQNLIDRYPLLKKYRGQVVVYDKAYRDADEHGFIVGHTKVDQWGHEVGAVVKRLHAAGFGKNGVALQQLEKGQIPAQRGPDTDLGALPPRLRKWLDIRLSQLPGRGDHYERKPAAPFASGWPSSADGQYGIGYYRKEAFRRSADLQRGADTRRLDAAEKYRDAVAKLRLDATLSVAEHVAALGAPAEVRSKQRRAHIEAVHRYHYLRQAHAWLDAVSAELHDAVLARTYWASLVARRIRALGIDLGSRQVTLAQQLADGIQDWDAVQRQEKSAELAELNGSLENLREADAELNRVAVAWNKGLVDLAEPELLDSEVADERSTYAVVRTFKNMYGPAAVESAENSLTVGDSSERLHQDRDLWNVSQDERLQVQLRGRMVQLPGYVEMDALLKSLPADSSITVVDKSYWPLQRYTLINYKGIIIMSDPASGVYEEFDPNFPDRPETTQLYGIVTRARGVQLHPAELVGNLPFPLEPVVSLERVNQALRIYALDIERGDEWLRARQLADKIGWPQLRPEDSAEVVAELAMLSGGDEQWAGWVRELRDVLARHQQITTDLAALTELDRARSQAVLVHHIVFARVEAATVAATPPSLAEPERLQDALIQASRDVESADRALDERLDQLEPGAGAVDPAGLLEGYCGPMKIRAALALTGNSKIAPIERRTPSGTFTFESMAALGASPQNFEDYEELRKSLPDMGITCVIEEYENNSGHGYMIASLGGYHIVLDNNFIRVRDFPPIPHGPLRGLSAFVLSPEGNSRLPLADDSRSRLLELGRQLNELVRAAAAAGTDRQESWNTVVTGQQFHDIITKSRQVAGAVPESGFPAVPQQPTASDSVLAKVLERANQLLAGIPAVQLDSEPLGRRGNVPELPGGTDGPDLGEGSGRAVRERGGRRTLPR